MARELVLRWGRHLGATVDIPEESDSCCFVTHLTDVYLGGLDSPPCLLIYDDERAATGLRDLLQRATRENRLAIVLAVSKRSPDITRQALPPDRVVVLDAAALVEIMESPEPLAILKQHVRSQIPRRRLIPFQILLPVSGSMFFGRSEILDQLLYRPQASFAIAGPGGIGKSSILAQYRHLLQRQRDPRIHRLVSISLKGVQAGLNDAPVRHVAMALNPSSRTYYETTAKDLTRILQQQSARLGGPLDLLIDEVDEVCQTGLFATLGEAAKQGHCRLVLCGRGVLLRLMLSPNSALAQRVQLLRPEPLPAEIARDLVLKPLGDLGFRVTSEDEVLAGILQLTGRLPHLLQFFLGKVANCCIDNKTEVISPEDVDTVTWDFESARFFTAPLREIQQKECARLALLLIEEMESGASIPEICRLAARHGLQLSEWEAFEMCSDLLINNVLAWSHGACFRIANGALVSYASRLGLVSGGKPAPESAAGSAAHRHGSPTK